MATWRLPGVVRALGQRGPFQTEKAVMPLGEYPLMRYSELSRHSSRLLVAAARCFPKIAKYKPSNAEIRTGRSLPAHTKLSKCVTRNVWPSVWEWCHLTASARIVTLRRSGYFRPAVLTCSGGFANGIQVGSCEHYVRA